MPRKRSPISKRTPIEFIDDFPNYWKPVPTLTPEWFISYEKWRKMGKKAGFTLS